MNGFRKFLLDNIIKEMSSFIIRRYKVYAEVFNVCIEFDGEQAYYYTLGYLVDKSTSPEVSKQDRDIYNKCMRALTDCMYKDGKKNEDK